MGKSRRGLWLGMLLATIVLASPLRADDSDTDLSYYNAVTPDFGPDWQLRFRVQFLFPK